MTQIQFNNNKILFSDTGKIALDPACCCCVLIGYPPINPCFCYNTITGLEVPKPDVRVIISGIAVPIGDITCTGCLDLNVDVTLSCGDSYELFPIAGFYCESNNPITTSIGTYVRRVQPAIDQCDIVYTNTGVVIRLRVVSDPATGGFPFDGANSTRWYYIKTYEFANLVLPKYSGCDPSDPRYSETVTITNGSCALTLVSEELTYSGPDVGTAVEDLLCDTSAINVSATTV